MTVAELTRIHSGLTAVYRPDSAGLLPVARCPRCSREILDAGELCRECETELELAERLGLEGGGK